MRYDDFIWLTDSRQPLMDPAHTVFFAIRGDRHDGHAFIETLYERGIRHFVIEKPALTPARHANLIMLGETTFIEVESSLHTLQTWAAEHRAQCQLPVIGITGSNGKTIVKEWLAQLLTDDYTICKSPKSYNSQLGVPLSVHQLEARHTLAIFEAGISQPQEMQRLEAVIRPTIGLFTNIGPAHDEGFKTRKQKVAEKLRLFTQAETLIYCADYQEINEEVNLLLRAVNPRIQLLTWSAHDGAMFRVSAQNGQLFLLPGEQYALDEDGVWGFAIPFSDPASVENLTHCLVAIRVLNALQPGTISRDAIQERVNRLRPVSMRLERKEGINGCVLIDDSYSNDLTGLQLALTFQEQQRTGKPNIVILSDLLQTGQRADELYAQIGQLISSQVIDDQFIGQKNSTRFIGIGPVISQFAELFPANSQFFDSTDAFMAGFTFDALRNAVVLVKGARPFAFERIVNRLQRQQHGTVLDINLDALTHNLNYYRAKASPIGGPNTKIMVMVKAFAYGSGSAEVAQWLQFHRVDYLAVAYADEGVTLRQNGVTLPIMVMNPAPETFGTLLDHILEPELYSVRILHQWAEFLEGETEGKRQKGRKGEEGVIAQAYSQPSPSSLYCHLKIDTGMHRLGFMPDEIPAVVSFLNQHPVLRIATVFSHLVGSDEAGLTDFSRQQHQRFTGSLAMLEAGLGYRPTAHLLNSAGIVRFPEFRFDMVRLGIGLYGVESSHLDPEAVRPVGTLNTTISQIKTVLASETVGYGRRGILARDSRIATIAIGYADGFDRRFGNGVGQVWIAGTRCPTVGNVCMDMTMVDVTDAPTAQEGDVVEIFGPNLTISALATAIGTIPYEILTGVSERVKRVFFREGN